MLALIVVNSIALGIQSELTDAVSSGEDSLMALVVILDMFDYFCLFWFVIEIILKWIDDFRMFWKNGWNIFDFLITGLSAAPEVITLFSGNENSPIAETARQLRVFRVLRSLKMVSRFGSLKIIVLTILQTFKTMAFLMLLLFTVAFIFAIVAIVVFEPLSSSERTDLEYKDSFKGLPRSLVTLFQLFTLDHWYDIYVDVTKVVNPTLTIIFIIAWIWVGAFVFRNIFVGIMVNNFTTISEALQEQTLDERKHMEMEKKRETLNLDIMKQEARRQSETLTRPAAVQSRHTGYKSFASTICSEYTTKQFQLDEKESDGWAKTVRDNLQTLAFHLEETRWPRDSLFRYFQIMEELQDNIQEYKEIQQLAVAALLKVHDTSLNDEAIQARS
ncbi:cation channel sperm-associated protein 2-like [Corticium candelabrum]|uniref:cation channel sperm-associated protein 2-like n=1 Tax=Corticium candelabrum TaxID=121492 RepID=UPI002E259C50|nr:cation channel sperm-associated protein 2-like [Corticium candelabrum]